MCVLILKSIFRNLTFSFCLFIPIEKNKTNIDIVLRLTQTTNWVRCRMSYQIQIIVVLIINKLTKYDLKYELNSNDFLADCLQMRKNGPHATIIARKWFPSEWLSCTTLRFFYI